MSTKLPTKKASIDWGLKWKWPIGGLLAFGFLIATPQILPGGWGVDSGRSTVTTVEKDPQGNTVKEVETTTPLPGKSLWDVLSLLGVPLALFILGAWFQKSQQKQAECTAREQREQDADETREEVLQLYFDRISTLLVDKNLMAIASEGDDANSEKQNLLEASLTVIRARTLSILRRFENDTDRKNSVIRFLVEAEIISQLKLDLRQANLEGTNLFEADLFEANLEAANLKGANLGQTNLRYASLKHADLRKVNLEHADLTEANFFEANLSKANLGGADLRRVNLTGANLMGTKLIGADLREANLTGADLRRANLGHTDLREADLAITNLQNIYFDEITAWPSNEKMAEAHNIPAKLQEQLELIPNSSQEQPPDQRPPIPPQ